MSSKKCIFLDESGFNLYLRRTLARAVKGKTTSVIVPTTRCVNQSLLSAISNTEVVFHKIVSGSVKKDNFIDFMSGVINKCREKKFLNQLYL